jgi:hypothetical protein
MRNALLKLLAVAAIPVAGISAAQAQTSQAQPPKVNPPKINPPKLSPPPDQSAQRMFRQLIASHHSVTSIRAASFTWPTGMICS